MEVLKWQLGRGRLAWAVALVKAAVWEAAPSQTLWRPGVDDVTVGRTKVLGTSRLCRAVRERMAACERQWSVQELSEVLLKESELLLKAGPSESYPVGDSGDRPGEVPEERFMDADDEVQNEDWSANELPTDVREDVMQKIPQEIRRSVRKAHVGLGHPT